MAICLCCSDRLLRHVRQSTVYWFCPVCRQEMPVLDNGNLQGLLRDQPHEAEMSQLKSEFGL